MINKYLEFSYWIYPHMVIAFENIIFYTVWTIFYATVATLLYKMVLKKD